MASQRIKEIGVRKILGASVFNLWQLLSKEFVVIDYYFFIYRYPGSLVFYAQLDTELFIPDRDILVDFCCCRFGALLITLITVSFQAIKAALANPVKSLRTE